MFGQWLSNLDLDIDSDVTMLITRTIKNWSHVLRQVSQEKFFFLLTSSFLSGIWSLLRGLTKLPSAKTLGACGWQNYFHLKILEYSVVSQIPYILYKYRFWFRMDVWRLEISSDIGYWCVQTNDLNQFSNAFKCWIKNKSFT